MNDDCLIHHHLHSFERNGRLSLRSQARFSRVLAIVLEDMNLALLF